MSNDHTAAFGIFSSRSQAENCINILLNDKFSKDDISVLLSNSDTTRQMAVEKNTKAPEGATTGATTGGVIGGALGLLAGIGVLAIPGLGPFIAAGPIMGALAGIGAGAAAGGIIGTLVGRRGRALLASTPFYFWNYVYQFHLTTKIIPNRDSNRGLAAKS